MLRPYIAADWACECGDHIGQVPIRDRLIERHTDSRLRQRAQVDLLHAGRVEDAGQDVLWHLDGHGIEEIRVHHAVSEPLERAGERCGVRVHAARDPPQPLGAVVDRVHRRDHSEQHLRGADVTRRFFASDVLLARLERHAEPGPPGTILRHADDASGQVAFEFIARREERRVWAAVAEGHAEPLRIADGDIGAPLPGRRQHCQRQQIRRDRDNGAGRVRPLAERPVVADRAIRRWILQQCTNDVAGVEIKAVRIPDDHLEPARRRAGTHDGDRLGMAIHIDEIALLALLFRDRLGEVHRFGGCGSLIEQRRIRDLETGEIRDHRLEREQRFQPSLRDFRLIRRVCRVPAGVLEHVSLDHGGREAMVIAHAQVGAENLVLRGELAQPLERFLLADRGRNAQRPAQADILGHDGVDEGVERVVAQRRKHRRLILRRGPDVPVLKQFLIYGHRTM